MLHLVRHLPQSGQLELRRSGTTEIIRLPTDYVGKFVEVVDSRFHTLGEFFT